MAARNKNQPGLFGPGMLPGSAQRLDEEWREVEVPGEIMAAMLGCRQSNLRQNYGDALIPCESRGLYRLETVAKAVERLRAARASRRDQASEEELEYQRLRNEKLRADTHKTRCATRDFVERLKAHARDELLDELTELAATLRDQVRGLPAELIDAHNRWIEALASRIDATRREQVVLSDEDAEAIRDLKFGE